MPIRLLAIDIDGTLLDSRGELSDGTRAAIEKARSAGVRVVLVTGRQYYRAVPVAEMLRLDSPIITASGALIKDPADHATIYREPFERKLLTDVMAMVVQSGFEPVLFTDTFLQGYDYHYNGQTPRAELAEFIELNRPRGRHSPGMLDDPPEGVFAGFAIGSRAAMLTLEKSLHVRLPNRLTLHVLRSPRYVGFMCEIAPVAATKWSGVRRVAESWGIAEEEICAVGDDVNDIAMIRAAGLGVAMANALPAVQSVADRIAPSHDDDGVAEVVRWILDGG